MEVGRSPMVLSLSRGVGRLVEVGVLKESVRVGKPINIHKLHNVTPLTDQNSEE